MKRFTSLLSKNKTPSRTDTRDPSHGPVDSPEASAMQAAGQFCESGSMSNGGEEVLHLPVLVEAAESSPPAAAAAALQIRKFLSRDWAQKPYVQYNAIMLIRILSDNPGPTFTRNFDKAFVSTVKELLRNSRDQSTQQILRETLDSLEVNKQHDEGSQALLNMWRKEKGQQGSLSSSRGQRGSQMPPNGQLQWQQPSNQYQYQNVYNGGQGMQQNQQAGLARTTSRHTLPPPFELASRIEEARNTAKILLQLIQSTPPEEVLMNPLCREFDERCQSAQRSMQTYINCDNPAPDHDTMQTLIETNEQLSLAGSRYQRAVLAARRTTGATPSPGPEAQPGAGYFQGQQSVGQRDSLMPPAAPSQPQANGFGSHQPPPIGAEGYLPPSGPPQSMTTSLGQRGSHSSQFQPPSDQQPAQSHHSGTPSNPFLDPAEHDRNPAPIAIESANYGPTPRQAASHRQQPSQAFSIDAEPTFAPGDRRNTTDLENAYSASATPVSQPSPNMMRGTPESSSTGFVSPNSPKRAALGPGPWQPDPGFAPSHVTRESSGSNGGRMQSAREEGNVAEIDSHSDVGRQEAALTTTGHSTMQTLNPEQQVQRVDVPGTGGLRGA